MLFLSFLLTFQTGLCQPLIPVKSNPNAGKCVALTFDDGIKPEIHSKMLDLFEQEKIKVTLFPVGENIKDEAIMYRTIEAGHEIGNHTMTHPELPKLSDKEIENEIKRFDKLLEKKYLYKIQLFRAPKLQYDKRVMRVLEEEALTPINATIGTRDWDEKTTSEQITSAACLSGSKAQGAIILMHEVENTLKALPQIISYYKKQGYTFFTVSELLKL